MKKLAFLITLFVIIISFPVYGSGADAGQFNIIRWADLNRDGREDKLVVEVVNNQAAEAAKLYVYDNETSALLYFAEAAFAHAGWNGLYLYTDGDGGEYLMQWLPQMYQGYCNYFYEVFSFDAEGEKLILATGALEFDSMEVSQTLEGADEVIRYTQRVNEYLTQSQLLMDTDGGKLRVGLKEDYSINKFTPEWLFDPQGNKSFYGTQL